MAAIERFTWTDHALERLDRRHLATFEVEAAIREHHDGRLPNEGLADWLVAATTPSGVSSSDRSL